LAWTFTGWVIVNAVKNNVVIKINKAIAFSRYPILTPILG
jgi:hypothetical protein